MKSRHFIPLTPNVVFVLSILSLWVKPVAAQEEIVTEATETASQSFSFVYIAQDSDMPVQEMEKKLQTAWNRAVQNGPTIFYLSRGLDEPLIVKVNTESDDNRTDFDNALLPAINQGVSYSVDGPHDKQQILNLLQEHRIVGEDGAALYKETNFDFHVGQDFWTSGNNETVIAALFFELNIKRYISEEFHFNVFCPRTITYNEDAGPFGMLNPDDCRRNINMDRSY